METGLLLTQPHEYDDEVGNIIVCSPDILVMGDATDLRSSIMRLIDSCFFGGV
jgi:hypothetical protein